MTEEHMVEHHVKYRELHGVDETVWITRSEHQRLHRRLRREGKCKIPADELCKISAAAYARTERGIKTRLKIRSGAKAQETVRRYNRSELVRENIYRYNKENRYIFVFRYKMMQNVCLIESLGYNNKTGFVTISSFFRANNSRKLYYIQGVI